MYQRLRSQSWLTGHRKRKEKKRGRAKRTTDSKSTQLMGIQGIIREMHIHGGGGEVVSYISG